MAISERVRLVVEIVGAQQGVQSMRTLDMAAQSLRTAFQQGQISVGQFQQGVQTDLGQLESFVRESSTRFQQSASGLVLPTTLAEQSEQVAERVAASTGRMQSEAARLNKQRQIGTEIQSRANLVLIDTSRIAQDAAFGFRAIVNNFDPLILNTQRFTAAIAAANGGVVTFTGVMRALGRVLVSPAGLLVLVNVLFLLSTFTDFLDPITRGFNNLKEAIFGVRDASNELDKEIEKTRNEFLELQENVQIDFAIERWEELNEELDKLADQRRANLIRRIGLTLNEAFFGDLISRAVFGATSGAMAQENERIAEEVERLNLLSEEYKEAVQDFRQLRESLLTADPNITSSLERDVLGAVEDVNTRLLEAQRRFGQEQIELENRIERQRAQARVDAIQREAESVASLQTATYQIYIQAAQNFLEASTEQEREFAQAQLDRVRGFINSLIGIRADLLALASDVQTQADENVNLRRQEFAIRQERQIEDITSRIRRVQTRIEKEGVEERIDLLRLETQEQQTQLQRQLEDYTRQFGQNGELVEVTEDYVDAIQRLFLIDKEAILEEDRQNEQDYIESVLRGQEELRLAYGASVQAIVEMRIARQQALLDDTPDTEIQRRREINAEIQRLEVELTRIKIDEEIDRRDSVLRQIRFEQRYAEAVEEANRRIQNATTRTTSQQIDLLREREAQLQDAIAQAQNEASVFEDIQRQIESVREELAAPGISEARQEELSNLLSGLEIQLALAKDAAKEYENLLEDLLGVQVNIVKEESSIWEQRGEMISGYVDRAIDEFFRLSQAQREFTELDVRYQEFQFRKRRENLTESLRDQRISQEEYSLEVQRLSQERNEFEKRVEEDKASVVTGVIRSVTDTIIQESVKRVARFVVETAIEVATARAATEVTKRATTQAMDEITAHAAPAAAATSIATFGGSAVAGAIAAAAAIASIFAAIRGFEEGGYTGNKGEKQVSGVVHGGEFVFTKKAVKGKPDPFYRLMRALERGLDPEQLELFIRLSDYPVEANVFRATAFTDRPGVPGFQEGGFVASLQPQPVSSNVDLSSLSENQRETTSAVRELADRLDTLEISVHAGRRTQDQLVRGGTAYRERKTVKNRFRRTN